MRKTLICIVVIFFGLVSVVMAQQEEADDVLPQDQDASEPMLGRPPMGSDSYPVVLETVNILKEVQERIQVSKFAEQNLNLMQRVDDVIKRDVEALNEFDTLMQSYDPDQPLVELPISFDMYAVAREAVDTLKELLDKLQGSKFAKDNLDLIEWAEDLLERTSDTL